MWMHAYLAVLQQILVALDISHFCLASLLPKEILNPPLLVAVHIL